MSLFEELKRRNVFRVGIAYSVASWLLLQLSDVLAPLLNLPETAQRYVLFALVIGFIPALIFAWAFELTPDGIRKEKDIDRSQSIAPQTGRKLDRTIIVILALAVAFLLYKQLGRQTGEPDKVAAQAPVEKSLPASTVKSVAVLPFVNMSSDPEQEYFSDGLSEELLNRLAKNNQLHVAARTSAFQFKGQNLDITEIGRQLNVAHVLEGSVRKSGNRLRITAQLIQVDNGFHLWSETYEREMDDVFAIQDDISSAISRALEIELGMDTGASGNTQPTQNIEAYNHYLQARFLLAQRGEENMRKADELFAEAIALDPGFSSAWSGKAFNMVLLYNYSISMSAEEASRKARQAATRALELDPTNAEALTAIGRSLAYMFDWKAAKASFEHAYALGPNDVGVLNLYGDFMGNTGDFEQGINLKRQAINLDPLSGVHLSDLAQILSYAGRYDEAEISARRGVTLSPNTINWASRLIEILVLNQKLAEARAEAEQTSQRLTEDPALQKYLARWQSMIYYRENNTEKLRELVAKEIHANQDNTLKYSSMDSAWIGFFVFCLDGPDAALPWLEQAYNEKNDPLISPLIFYLPERMSDDPEWLEFWNRPGLKELLDMRRAHPYPSNGLWRASEFMPD
jgi:TolB-like protein/Flp pilus assembly protein TadD